MLVSPCVLKLDECEWRPPPVLEVDEDDLAVLVEEVLNVLGPDVGREVAHVDAGLAGGRHRAKGQRSMGTKGGWRVVALLAVVDKVWSCYFLKAISRHYI